MYFLDFWNRDSFPHNNVFGDNLRHLHDLLHKCANLDSLFLYKFYWYLLPHRDHDLSIDNFNVSDCDQPVDVFFLDKGHFLLPHDFNRNPPFDWHFFNYLTINIHSYNFFLICNLYFLLLDKIRYFFSHYFLNFLGQVDGHLLFDFNNLQNLNLPLNKLFDDLGHVLDIFDDPRHHDDLFHDLFNLHDARNFHDLFHYLFGHDSHLLNDFFLNYNWNRNLLYNFSRNLLSVGDEPLDVDVDQLRLLLNIRHGDLHCHWHLPGNPNRHSFLNFDILSHDLFAENWYFLDSVNVFNDLFDIAFDLNDFFLNNIFLDFLDERHLGLDRYLNYFFGLMDDLNNLFNCVDNFDWFLYDLGNENRNLLFNLNNLWFVDEIIDDLFNLHIFYDLYWNFFLDLDLLDVGNFSKNLNQSLFIPWNFNDLSNDLLDRYFDLHIDFLGDLGVSFSHQRFFNLLDLCFFNWHLTNCRHLLDLLLKDMLFNDSFLPGIDFDNFFDCDFNRDLLDGNVSNSFFDDQGNLLLHNDRALN